MKAGFTLTVMPSEKNLLSGLAILSKRRVLVGFPASGKGRTNDSGFPEPVTNAALGYIHDQGSPLHGIPQREFLRPGIKAAEEAIVQRLSMAGKAAMDGNKGGVDAHLNEAGIKAVSAVRNKITSGPFAPLKKATLRARRKRGFRGSKPLIVTHQLSNAITYVLRDKS